MSNLIQFLGKQLDEVVLPEAIDGLWPLVDANGTIRNFTSGYTNECYFEPPKWIRQLPAGTKFVYDEDRDVFTVNIDEGDDSDEI